MRKAILACLVAARMQAQGISLEGELVTRQVTDLSHLAVRLEATGKGSPEQAFVSVTGSFRFAQLPPGDYTLTVLDERGNEITREQVLVSPGTSDLKVQLPESAEPPRGTVSVAQLRHKPDKGAVHDWMSAQRLSDMGNYRGAEALLEKAVTRDPRFAEAHENLGAQLIRLHQPERAAAEFQKALALDSSSALYHANLALTVAQLGRREEAARLAQRALEIDSTSAIGHYVMGWVLCSDRATQEEAIRHLKLAAKTLPAAQAALDHIRR